ncbi:MAG: hypothetical protein WDK95_08335 [Syntrophorhabdaceae bacterium]
MLVIYVTTVKDTTRIEKKQDRTNSCAKEPELSGKSGNYLLMEEALADGILGQCGPEHLVPNLI